MAQGTMPLRRASWLGMVAERRRLHLPAVYPAKGLPERGGYGRLDKNMTLCPCGNEITRQLHDSGKDWAWKVANKRCRRKCLRLFPAAKSRPLPSLPSAVKWVEGETRAVPKVETWRSEEYKAWVRSLPCLHCGAVEGVAAHHENEVGKGGKGIKTDDSRCVPLCSAKCHVLRHSVGRAVWKAWKIDIEAVILQLCEVWQRQQSFKSK